MTSVHSSSLDADEVDLSGLVESVVDSDEEDLAESMDVSRHQRNQCYGPIFNAQILIHIFFKF